MDYPVKEEQIRPTDHPEYQYVYEGEVDLDILSAQEWGHSE